ATIGNTVTEGFNKAIIAKPLQLLSTNITDTVINPIMAAIVDGSDITTAVSGDAIANLTTFAETTKNNIITILNDPKIQQVFTDLGTYTT
ncbi:hypothetical protein OEK97_28095, partial [Escherichia coli]|uniref:hypothetical protein n=1 Tax=Escherichia coli TaxID=562 RepID=UPI0021DAD1A4